MCLEAVKQNGYALQDIKNKTDRVCLEAVKQNGSTLKYVDNQTYEICLEAIKQNPSSLKYVNDQTEEICLEAVRLDGNALRYVKHQTDKICLEALNNNVECASLVNIDRRSIALILLKCCIQHNVKDKKILNDIINKFNDDEFKNIYTKHKLWKYVDFSKLKMLNKYFMTL